MENYYLKFKHLLGYFVAHLQWLTNSDSTDIGYQIYIDKYVKAGNFYKQGHGYKDDNIEKQVAEWDHYDIGQININVQGNYGTDYTTKKCYLNWRDTGINVIAEWQNNKVIDFQVYIYDYEDTGNWESKGKKYPLSELNLFDKKDDVSPSLVKLYNLYYQLYEQYLSNIQMKKIQDYIDVLKQKGQIILQGAPGTGKTYTAKNMAETMIFNHISADKKEQACKLSNSEQFKLVQFHPSYSYEDFVRGIIVDTEDSNNGLPTYKPINKIFGEFAERATKNWLDSQKDTASFSHQRLIAQQYDLFKQSIENDLQTQSKYPLKNSTSIVGVDDDALRCNRYSNLKDCVRLKDQDIILGYIGLNQTPQVTIKNNNKLSKSARSGMYYIYQQLIEKFTDYLKTNNLQYSNHSKEQEKEELKNYVLVIDEINRANLSSVLGELIYALEYRGEKIDTMYSVDDDNGMIVPPNLFIIGTMNTADRSVGQIDYALRRRFAFVTILPTVLDINGFNRDLFKDVSSLFVENIDEYIKDPVNTQIKPSKWLSEEFLPSDVWIGHSYFIGNKAYRLKYEIIPILKEYIKDGILKTSITTGENIYDKIKSLAK